MTQPARGVRITASDVLITAEEVERFEEVHGIGRSRGRGNAGPGLPPRYDWDGFYVAVFKRLYTLGFPTRQRELVLEMQEWFIANSPTGEARTKARSGVVSRRYGTS